MAPNVLTDVKGNRTMADIRQELGLHDVEWYVVKRQLGYLGHVARYPTA